MTATPDNSRLRQSDVSALLDEPRELRELRFDLPCLYPLSPDAGGKSYSSALDGYGIRVAIPASPPNQIRGRSGQWIVPRTVYLTVPAPLAETLRMSDAPVVEWWRQVCAWLAAWVGEAPGRDRQIQRHVLPVDQSVESTAGEMNLYALPGQAHASRDQLCEALELAGQRLTPPGEYRLLSRAQELRESGDRRACVIDAAGAVEIAMQAALDRQRSQAAQAPTKRPGGLWHRYKLLRSLGADLGVNESAVRGFADVRNEAVHRGANPSAQQTEELIRTAKAIIHALSGQRGRPAARLPG